MSQVPPPTASGYQPAPGEGFAHIDVEVRPSWGYQTEGVSGRYVFASPRSLTEVQPAIDAIHQTLEAAAAAKVDQLVALREGREQQATAAKAQQARQPAPQQAPQPAQPAPQQQPAPQPAQQQPAPQQQGNGLVSGPRKSGGQLKYLPEQALGKRDLEDRAKALASEQSGIPVDQLICFDNRPRLQQGQGQAAPAVVKARRDTPLALAMPQGRDTVAWVGFNDDGSLAVKVTDEASNAMVQAQQPQHGTSDVPF